MSPYPFVRSQSREADSPTQAGLYPEQRAKRPHAPEPTPGVRKALAENAVYTRQREAAERRSVLRGLVLLAILVLVVSLMRAGADRAFYTGWWRQW